MSDETTGADTGPDTGDVSPDDETRTAVPSPRPRSATSRARRIGGAAASPRPSADDTPTVTMRKSTTDDDAKTTAKAATKPGAKSAGKAAGAASKVSTSKSSAKAASSGKAAASSAKASANSTKPTKPGDRTKAAAVPAKSGAMTFSVPGWLRWAPGFAFAAVAIVFLTLFAVARIGGDDAPSSTSASMRQEVLAAAKTCLATVNTYRYDQLDRAQAAGVKCTTGKLTTDFTRTMTSVIGKNAPRLKAVQLAKITTAGVEAVTQNGKQWTVLAYGQLNVTNANTSKQGRIDPFAVVARLQEVKGNWVLSKIDTVSSFSV